ncbi:hypothetical protein [Mycoplasmoides genitalium]|nr:hypothetical protein [Mycoplasmoides genitalium]
MRENNSNAQNKKKIRFLALGIIILIVLIALITMLFITGVISRNR